MTRVPITFGCSALMGAAMFMALAQTGPTVSVTGGQVRGRVLEEGAVFKGVPFARAPIGDLRWRAPEPVQPWTGVRDAGEYAATCAQIDANWNRVAAARGSEDCLFLNVWAPQWPPTARRPVMVWIHGGGNMAGSALGAGGIEPPFDGAHLAHHGVVLVTIQYRVGMFGFLAHPELTSETPGHGSGNYGLLDQIAALKWVKANIEKFGGDPGNVTVFGQSGGGQDTGLLLVSPLSQGLFQHAIEESGTVIGGARLTPSLADAEKLGMELAAKMKAPPGRGAVAYMRRLSAADVLKASPPYGGGSIGPHVDGYAVPRVAAQMFAAGQEHRVDLMIGSNARERMLPGGAEALRKQIDAVYGDLAPRAASLYAHPSDYAPYGDAGAQFLADTGQRCPLSQIAQWHTGAGNAAYVYEFSHAFPGSNRGAPHSGELRYVFGMLPAGQDSAEERTISDVMETYWTNFAKTGNPNATHMPAWPRFDAKARAYLEFTDAGPVAREGLRRDFCAVFTDLLKARMSQ